MWTVESNQKLSGGWLFSSLSYKKMQNSYLDFILLKFLPNARCCMDLFLLSHTIKVDRSDSKPGKNESKWRINTHVDKEILRCSTVKQRCKAVDDFLYCSESPEMLILFPPTPHQRNSLSSYFTGINSFSTKTYLNLLCNQWLNKVNKEWGGMTAENFISPHPFVKEDSDILFTGR